MWRILTCHWVHWNAQHLAWSLATFTVLGVLCERDHRGRFLTCLAVAAFAIPVTLSTMGPERLAYAGLSGLDSALFVLVAVGLVRQKGRKCEWLWVLAGATLLLAFFAKTGFEVVTQKTIFASLDEEMVPVPLAHVVGGAVGVLIGMAWPPSRGVPKKAPTRSCIARPCVDRRLELSCHRDPGGRLHAASTR
jgi:rhomboid family GlyGly-CTERM serine protease